MNHNIYLHHIWRLDRIKWFFMETKEPWSLRGYVSPWWCLHPGVVWLWMEFNPGGGGDGGGLQPVSMKTTDEQLAWMTDVYRNCMLARYCTPVIAWGPDWLRYEWEGLALTAWEYQNKNMRNRWEMLPPWFNFCLSYIKVTTDQAVNKPLSYNHWPGS